MSHLAVEPTVHERPSEQWLANLKTGDAVVVCDAPSGRAIYTATVRVTPTGRIYVVDSHSRVVWKRGYSNVAGAGPRFITAPKESR